MIAEEDNSAELTEESAVRAFIEILRNLRFVMRCLEHMGDPEKHELLYQESHWILGMAESSIQKVMRRLYRRPSWRKQLDKVGPPPFNSAG